MVGWPRLEARVSAVTVGRRRSTAGGRAEPQLWGGQLRQAGGQT